MSCVHVRLNRNTGCLDPSVFQFKEKSLNSLGCLVLKVYQMLGLIKVERIDNDEELFQATNCTLINLALKFAGPSHEKNLATGLLVLQVL